MESIILAAVLLLILGLAVLYVVREKKKGVKCIGCPHAREYAARNSGKGCGSGQ
jgi:hypothetical protein